MPFVVKKPKLEFMLGCDPEFGFTENSRFVMASKVVPSTVLYTAEFGADPGGVTELRPKPAATPYGLVSNLFDAMAQGFRSPLAQKLRWRAGSSVYGHPIGGHIHFGLKEAINNEGLCVRLAAALNKYVAIPVMYLENMDEATNRKVKGYGLFTDNSWRFQPHGVEYRVLASWLVSPRVTQGILSMAAATVYEVLNNGLPDAFQTGVDASHFKDHDLAYFKDKKGKALDTLPKFELYTKYSAAIAPVMKLMKAEEPWFNKAKHDMRLSWGLWERVKQRVQLKINRSFEEPYQDVSSTVNATAVF